MTKLQTAEDLAAAVRPLCASQELWDSLERETAENAFCAFVLTALPHDEACRFSDYCFKATTEEMVDKGLEMLRSEA
tara:strand:- start:24507 stop:24737 length:231 start_codon:yes stop_codon:yes gene_type:complete